MEKGEKATQDQSTHQHENCSALWWCTTSSCSLTFLGFCVYVLSLEQGKAWANFIQSYCCWHETSFQLHIVV